MEHMTSRNLPSLTCPNIKTPESLPNPYSFQRCRNKASSESFNVKQGLSQKNINMNVNMQDLREGITGVQVAQLPPLDSSRSVSQLFRNRSKISTEFRSILSQKPRSYIDPIYGARLEFLQRIAEIAALESETVRQENLKKLRAKRDEQ